MKSSASRHYLDKLHPPLNTVNYFESMTMMLTENYILISLMPNPKTEAKPTEESKNLFTVA